MQAIGLVPWVRRSVASVQQPSADKVIPVAGDSNAELLLIFDITGNQTHWPLDRADDALLEGMLRAIGLSKNAVFCCAIDQPIAQIGKPLTDLCGAPRKHFLYFGAAQLASDLAEPATMSINSGRHNGWQLPPLATLRSEPQRKRHAWQTLKQLRSSLDQL